MTSAKIANDAIIHTKIADGQVRAEHLDGNAVETGAIKDDAVTSAKIATLTALAINISSFPSSSNGQPPYMTTWATGTIYRDTTSETLKVYNPPPPGGGGMPP
eukprot:SAG22_NODE_438_length_10500_cov_13.037496_6_plen_103_part_00